MRDLLDIVLPELGIGEQRNAQGVVELFDLIRVFLA